MALKTVTKPIRRITPVVVLSFPFLTKTDTKFYTLGKYTTKAVLDPKNVEHAAFMDTVKDAVKEIVDAEVAADGSLKDHVLRDVFAEQIDKETGKPTGNFLMYAEQKAKVKHDTKGEINFNIQLVDSKKAEWDRKVPIYGGTKAKLSVDIRFTATDPKKQGKVLIPGTVGIQFRLVGVQVLDLVSSNADAGFGEEEGYTLPASEGKSLTGLEETTNGSPDF